MASRSVSNSASTAGSTMWTISSPAMTGVSTSQSTTNLNGYFTSTDFGSYNNSEFGAFEILMTGLQESKIIEILDNISQNISGAEFRRLVISAVRVRHFSEDFLMKYIDYLNDYDLFEQHKENIKSKEYATLALYLETKEKK